jgi:hypothetical protein
VRRLAQDEQKPPPALHELIHGAPRQAEEMDDDAEAPLRTTKRRKADPLECVGLTNIREEEGKIAYQVEFKTAKSKPNTLKWHAPRDLDPELISYYHETEVRRRLRVGETDALG